jgi:hypothetical protein
LIHLQQLLLLLVCMNLLVEPLFAATVATRVAAGVAVAGFAGMQHGVCRMLYRITSVADRSAYACMFGARHHWDSCCACLQLRQQHHNSDSSDDARAAFGGSRCD